MNENPENSAAANDPIPQIEVYKQFRSHYNSMRSGFYRLVPVYVATVGAIWVYTLNGKVDPQGVMGLTAIFVMSVTFAVFLFKYGSELKFYEDEIAKFENISLDSYEKSSFVHEVVPIRGEYLTGWAFLVSAGLALYILIKLSGGWVIYFTIGITIFMLLLALTLLVVKILSDRKKSRAISQDGQLDKSIVGSDLADL